MDWVTPRRRQACANVSEVYGEPLSVWKITPSTWPPLVAAAMFKAAVASWAVG